MLFFFQIIDTFNYTDNKIDTFNYALDNKINMFNYALSFNTWRDSNYAKILFQFSIA